MGHSCRECASFHRIEDRDRSGRIGVSVQGFCILGQLQADFSLYYSTSKSRECGAFSRSEYNVATTEMEQRLSHGMDDFKMKLIDRRTKEYKAYKKCLPDEEALSIFGDTDENGRFHLLHFDQKFREVWMSLYLKIHDKEFRKLWKRHRLVRPKYYEIVHELTTGMQATMMAMCQEQYDHQDELWTPQVNKIESPVENDGYA